MLAYQYRHLQWRVVAVALILFTFATLFAAPPAPAAAQTTQRCFAETGQCIARPIRAYWEANGGLAVFGYPITNQRRETVEGRNLELQWFERDRLEIQASGLVTAGRLGVRFLDLQFRAWKRGEPMPYNPDCRVFAETGQQTCGAFLRYWQASGGLERFGYPVTEMMLEMIEGREYLVQYFERRRMELHSELPGSPVLLGLLGNEIGRIEASASQAGYPGCLNTMSTAMRQAYALLNIPEGLGCPLLYAPTDIPASTQRFETGEMIWINPVSISIPGGVLPPTVFAYHQSVSARYPRFQIASDTWQAGIDPDTPNDVPPAGRYAPWRGFGKVWAADTQLRGNIGWAIEPQALDRRAEYQLFDRGIMLRVYELGSRAVVYAALSNNQDVPLYAQRVMP